MSELSDHIQLVAIEPKNHKQILRFMHKIYPPSYHHLWEDGGSWYVETIYSEKNLKKELAASDSAYYLVNYDAALIGILRVEFDKVLIDLPDKKASKLNRVYLDQRFQSLGIGQYLLEWVEERTKKFGSEILWLEAMDTQEQALKFYQKNGFKISGQVNLEYGLLFKELRGMYRMWKSLS